MIDYEKLKLAHELADKYCINNKSLEITVIFNDVQNGITPYYNISDKNKKLLCHDRNLDEILIYLKELSKTNSKYKAKDVAWRIDDEDTPEEIYIYEVDYECDMYLYFDGEYWWSEEQLYPSREASIKAQIQYWQALKNKESSICSAMGSVPSICDHESDGLARIINNDRDINQLKHFEVHAKCIKCGDFF